MAAVRADGQDRGSSVRREAGRPAGAERGQVEVAHVVDPVEVGGLRPRGRARRRGRRPPASVRRPARLPGRRTSSTRTRCRRACCLAGGRRARRAAGRRAGRRCPTAPGARASRKAAHRRGRAGELVAARPAGRRRSGTAGHRTTSSSPSRTSRRHSTSRLCSSSGEVARRQLGAVARPSRARAGPAAAPGARGRRAAPGPRRRRRRSTHGCPGRRRRRVSASIPVASAIRSSRPPASRGGRPVRNRSTSASATAAGSRRRTASASAGEAVGRGPRPAARGRRGSRPAGGRRAPSASRRPTLARRRRLRQVSWLMPMVTCSETVVLGPGGVRGAGREVHATTPGSSSTVASGRPSAVHLPQLGAVGLEDEHVVGVGVHREALGARRGEVGVGLAGMAELELQLGDQVGRAGGQ